MGQQNCIGRASREFVLIEVCQCFPQLHKKTIYTMYGQVLQFRSFKTSRALMCKIHEQNKVSMLKPVLCSLMNVSAFFI